MVSAQERLTRTFTRSSHTYTRTERTEISKTRGGETTREVHVEESTRVGGAFPRAPPEPFGAFGAFGTREGIGAFTAPVRAHEGASCTRGSYGGVCMGVCSKVGLHKSRVCMRGRCA